MAELWQWSAFPDAERAAVLTPSSSLAAMIEGYLCRVFQLHNSSQSGGWWCDGIFDLTVTGLSPTVFLLVGVAYWAEGNRSPFYLAPFELEFHFQSHGAPEAQRVIVRFGAEGHDGTINKIKHNAAAPSMIYKRPQQNSDWAMAIELT